MFVVPALNIDCWGLILEITYRVGNVEKFSVCCTRITAKYSNRNRVGMKNKLLAWKIKFLYPFYKFYVL